MKTLELEIDFEYDYQPREEDVGVHESVDIHTINIKTPAGEFAMSDYVRAGDWYKELKAAVMACTEIGASEDKHWQAVGALTAVLKRFSTCRTLHDDLLPVIDEYRDEWEADILQDRRERAIDAAEMRAEAEADRFDMVGEVNRLGMNISNIHTGR